MAAISGSILYGVATGGAAAYLNDRVQHESADKSPNTWTSVAFQVNHLLLLAAETLRAAHVGFSLSPVIRVAYALAPLTLLAGYNRSEITETEANCAHRFNQVYHVAVIASSVAMLALKVNPGFAVASLAMLAINAVVTGIAKQAFDYVRNTAAAVALLGYGAQVALSGRNLIAVLAKLSTAVMTVNLLAKDLLTNLGNKLAAINAASNFASASSLEKFNTVVASAKNLLDDLGNKLVAKSAAPAASSSASNSQKSAESAKS
jgi:hypothetical protein